MDKSFYEAAQSYLSLGWSLLPMQFIEGTDGKMVKKPMVKWKEYQDHQPTWEEVEGWLNQGWFLGIITGKTSGIVIIDDDRGKHGLTPTTLQSPVTAKTKSGGKHFYYKYDRLITNHANSDLFVDIRGEGGYCVLPPFNGYEWVSPPTPENMAALIPVSPKAEAEIIGDRKQTGNKIVLSDYEKIPAGGRNETLLRLALSVWNNDKLTEQEKVSQIEWLNETRCVDAQGRPDPIPTSELTVIINQAKNFVTNNPKIKQEAKMETKPTTSMADVISERLSDLELEKDCPSTGLDTLDEMVKGFIPKHTYVLTGDTNVGKTSLACFFACSMASQQKKVLYVALEPDTGVADYIASIINSKRFDTLTPEDYNFHDLSIDFYFKKQIRSVEELIFNLKGLAHYDLIIIDHIGYFVSNTQNTNQEQSNVMKRLAEIATENKCSVMAIAHIRKPDNHTKNRIPTINDISGSAAFKQDATDVWIVYRTPDPEDDTHTKFLNTGLLIVAKSKSGSSGPISIAFGQKKAGIYELNTISNSIEDNFNE